MNYKLVLRILGVTISFEAMCMLLPSTCSLVYGDGQIKWFLLCIAINLAVGVPLSLIKPKERKIYSKEGFYIVALSWIALSLFGSLPFAFSGYIPDIVDAMFETVSGFTTTGASILPDVEVLPESIVFWRSFTHWIGGMGVLVFLVALLPLSGGSNMYLMKAESTGPSVSKLVPKVRSTAKILYIIYFCITVIQVILLLCGGMNMLDALVTTFGSVGTGGFGIRNDSMASFTTYQQSVVTVFMILCGINFSLFYLIVTGKVKKALGSGELKTYLGIILVAVAIIVMNCMDMYGSLGETFRHAAFQVGSIITTTGYSTVDFDKWPELSKAVLVILMFVGGCGGSTGGGIKVSRIIILAKSIVKEIKISSHPHRVCKIKMDGRTVEHETLRGVCMFLAAYVVIYAFSMLIISLDGRDFTTNFTAVAATINNIGPGLAGVGPMANFGDYSNLSKIVLMLDMLIGRLEIFPILVLFAPRNWKK